MTDVALRPLDVDLVLRYGRSGVTLRPCDAPEALVLTTAGPQVHVPADEQLEKAMRAPVGKRPLADELLASGARRVVIIVNDITRPTPYGLILGPILQAIDSAGVPASNVTLVVATGIHRPMTPREISEVFGPAAAASYTFLNHDCDADDLVYLGKLCRGSEFYVNRTAAEADFVIATGVIAPHYFAGFSGGRKSVCPGVSGRKTIASNHSLLTDPRASACNIDGNPVSEEMMDAAKRLKVGFIVNVVVDAEENVVGVVAGDLEQAWLAGVDQARAFYEVTIPEPVDIVVASAGGFPKDINIYQAQKAIDNAARVVRPGGTIVLLAESPEGCGEKTFEEWMLTSNSLSDIFDRFARGFKLGGHKAYSLARVLAEKQVILVSALDPGFVERLFMTPAATLSEALQMAARRHPSRRKTLVMPHAGVVVPSVGGGESRDQCV